MSQAQGVKYLALLDCLRDDISTGVLSAGQKLPPVRELAWSLEITPGTVARAYQKGIDEGLLTANVGRGTFVAERNTGRTAAIKDDIHPVNLRSTRTPDVGQDKAIQQALTKMSKRSVVHYNQYPGVDDYTELKQALRDWLLISNVRVDPGSIILSYGAQNGLMMAMATCLQGKKPVVLCEELFYHGLRWAAETLRVELVPIEMDDEGFLPAALEQACQSSGATVLVTCSNVHNPTTVQTSQRRRLEIAAIAKRYDMQIIDDDCWNNEPTEADSYSVLCKERYWLVSSLTKAVSAGLRFGFVVCPPGYTRQTMRTMQSMFQGLSQPVAEIALELLTSGQAAKTRVQALQVINDRVQRAANILGHCNIRLRENVPFVWLELPKGWRASRFALHCERNDIIVRPSDEFTLPGGRTRNGIRVSLNANIPVDVLENALRKISDLLSNPPLDDPT